MHKHSGRKLAKGRRKVRERFKSQSQPLPLVAWHSWTIAHASGFFLTGLFWLSRPSFPKKTRAGTCCNVASPATLRAEELPVLLLSSSVSLSINIHQTASGADVAERIFAKGARKERERRTWPGQVVGQSGFYEKPGFAHAGREHH